ncbi:hypothetical protein EKN09_21420 [Vibrio penaeicida]|nr:hypothetical protein EKN09_21420 [Vibrio penaeicida]
MYCHCVYPKSGRNAPINRASFRSGEIRKWIQ